MNKIIPIILLVAILVVGWLLFKPSGEQEDLTTASKQAADGVSSAVTGEKAVPVLPDRGSPQAPGPEDLSDAGEPAVDDSSTKPATQVYKSAEEALAAVKKAAGTYDDLVLEQFTDLGANCSWCDSFYKSVSDTALSADTKPDERSYFSELLAISGRVDNIKTLVEAAKGAQKPEDAQAFNEALELAVGKDDMVQYLGKELDTTNQPLKEAIVAGLTNQGTRMAFDTLYDETVKSGNPDGHYSQGIGTGEMVLEPDAFPSAQEKMLKRDQYAHLSVKALLNSGIEGTRLVFDALSSSKDPETDAKLFRTNEMAEHFGYDEETEQYFKKMQTECGNEICKKLAKDGLAEFAALTEDTSAEADQQQ